MALPVPPAPPVPPPPPAPIAQPVNDDWAPMKPTAKVRQAAKAATAAKAGSPSDAGGHVRVYVKLCSRTKSYTSILVSLCILLCYNTSSTISWGSIVPSQEVTALALLHHRPLHT